MNKLAHTSKRLEAELLDIRLDVVIIDGGLVVVLDEMDDIKHGEHPCKGRFLAVPKRGGYDIFRGNSTARIRGQR
jgi:hypothetical protein